MSATLQTEADAAARLHRLISARPALHAGFLSAWRQIDAAADSPAALDDWCRAVLALLDVNAGAASLIAFWSLRPVPGADLSALAGVGRAAASICRQAGAAATRACLEATGRLADAAGARAAGRGWWRGLQRLADQAPACVAAAAAQAETIIAATGIDGFPDFIAAGLKTMPDRAGRLAYFSLQHPAAREALDRAGAGPGFSELERRLSLFATALWGRRPALLPAPARAGQQPRRATLADGVVLLPASLRGVPPTQTPALYRAMVAHASAHVRFTPGRFAVGSLKPLQLILIGLIEDARVEWLAMRRFPGLRRLWQPFHTARPAGPPTVPALLARVSRALFDPAYQDDDDLITKARALFDSAMARPEDAAISRHIGGLLGNDIGQRRLQFNAKLYVIEPAYRDDGMGLWDFGEPPDHAMEMPDLQIEAARPREAPDPGEGDQQPDEATGRARIRPAEPNDRGVLLARYPEWDRAASVARPDWTQVWDTPITPGAARQIDSLLDQVPGLRARIDRLVRGARPGRPVRLRRQPDGAELDIDAAVEAAVDVCAGRSPSANLFRDSARRTRDLATLLLIDLSHSTADRVGAGTVLDVERLAVALLASAMQRLGDPFALFGFASNGRAEVRLQRVKDFRGPYDAAARARLAGLSSGLSTRLGAALRHAGAEIATVRAHRRMVLVLSDGAPSDIDVADPLDLVEDARRATLGLRAQGIDVFGVTLDPAGAGAGPAIFGRGAHLALRRAEDLPARLAHLYFQLSRK